MKWAMILALLGIIAALVSAGLLMLRRRPDDDASVNEKPDARMARALAVRVGLSVALFVMVLVAWKFGWIQPQGVPLGR